MALLGWAKPSCIFSWQEHCTVKTLQSGWTALVPPVPAIRSAEGDHVRPNPTKCICLSEQMVHDLACIWPTYNYGTCATTWDLFQSLLASKRKSSLALQSRLESHGPRTSNLNSLTMPSGCLGVRFANLMTYFKQIVSDFQLWFFPLAMHACVAWLHSRRKGAEL